MLRRNPYLNTAIAALAVLLILTCVSVVFLPHSHEGPDVDCAVCALIEFSCYALAATVLLSAVGQFDFPRRVVRSALFRVRTLCDGTPVGLKVKLSN